MSRQDPKSSNPPRFVQNSDIQQNPSSSRAAITNGELGNTRLPTNDMSIGASSQDGGVLIYIDNSNIWINTMQASAKRLGFKADITQDLRTRVNISNLLKLCAAERPIIRAVLYGSQPPPVSKFWNKIKEIEFCEVEVQVTRRSTFSNKEREVDQSIMLDIGVDLVIHQNHARHGGTIIIFTGDGGMVNAVRKALEYGWNVELWAYHKTMANIYKDEETKNQNFKIEYLEFHFPELVFYNFKLHKDEAFPPERSCVLSFNKIPADQKSKVLGKFIRAITKLVGMPMVGRYCEEESSGQTHLVVVCSVEKLILKEDARSDDYQKRKANSTTLQQNHSQSSRSKMSNTKFKISAEQWNHVKDILNLQFLKEDFKTKLERLVEDYINTPKYDFTKDIYQLIQDRIAATLTPTSSIPQTTNQNPTPSTSTKNVVVPPSYDFDSLIQEYKPKELRSYPRFLQELKIDDATFGGMALEASGEDEDDKVEGKYTVQKRKKGTKKYQKYTESCKYSFRCRNGCHCAYDHPYEEKKFFKLQPNALLRASYKYKECDYYKKDQCRYAGELWYLCPYSHGYFCLTCKRDDDGGHNPDTCKAPTSCP